MRKRSTDGPEIRHTRLRVRNASRTLALFVISCAFGLLLAEGLLRIYAALAPQPSDSLFLPDPDMIYRLRPGGSINELGFRDRPRSREKPEGVYRILGIGDSFVYGNTRSLEDHFLRVAERCVANEGALDGSGRDSLELLPMGVGGYSPENEVGVLRAIGCSLSPDLVVLNFFVGNDVTGIPTRGRVIAGKIYIVGSPYPWLDRLRRSLVFVLAENLLLPPFREKVLGFYTRILHRRTEANPSRPAVEAPSLSAPPGGPSGAADDRTAQARARSYSKWYFHSQLKDLPVYLKHPDHRTEALWEESEAYLREFDRICRTEGVPWILHLIPADLQIDAELRSDVLRALGQPEELFDFDAPQQRLRAFARELSVPCHDPLSAMRRANDPSELLYRRDDIHWTDRGNRIAGELLGAFLADWISRNQSDDPAGDSVPER